MISDGIFVYADYRQTGKTTKLIKEAHENAGTIVTYNLNSKQRILTMAKDLGLKIKDPITFNDFIDGQKKLKRKICIFYIDDMDCFLKKLFPLITIKGMTITKK